METLSTLIKVSLPNYLQELPVPNSVTGLAKLSAKDWLTLTPFVGTVSFLVYVTVQTFRQPRPPIEDKPKVNPRIQKENPKVVTAADIEDLGDKVAYCRCWRSRKFPLCDGAHGRHNEETGDNVGPLVLKRREPTSS